MPKSLNIFAAVTVTALALSLAVDSAKASTISVFKSGTGIDMAYTTNLYSGFQSANASDVVQVTMQNQAFSTNPSTFWAVQPNSAVVGASAASAFLMQWDLSSVIPVGSTVTKAQIRLYATAGNTPGSVAAISTHDWSQGGATTAGYNNPTNPNLTWGPSSNAFFGENDLNARRSAIAPQAATPVVWDVTADLQAVVNGSKPNYGWALVTSGSYSTSGPIGNYGYSTNATTTESQRPALFVEYVPVPEPTQMVSVAAIGAALGMWRLRKLRRNGSGSNTTAC